MSRHDGQRGTRGPEWDMALDATPVLVSVHDSDYNLLKVNAAFAALLKSTQAEIVGRKCYEVIHGTPEPPAHCPHTRALNERTHQKEKFFEPHLGVMIQVSVSPIFGDDGRLIASIHIAKDMARTAPLHDDAERQPLTGRQKQILSLFCSGRVVKEIAFQLKISPKTVEYHKYRMMKKFSVRSLSELITRVLTRSPSAIE